jgi:hypothetical protein
MRKHAWAADWLKLERAIGILGADASEEALKAKYAEFHGKFLADDGTPLVPEAPKKAVSAKKPAKKAAKKK